MAIHEDYIELISAAVDGALTEEETLRLQSHLAQCADCRSLLRDLQDLHAALHSLPSEAPPADLTGRILTAVAEDNVTLFPTKKSRAWKGWTASAAVIALVLAGSWGLWQGSDKVVGGDVPAIDPQMVSQESITPEEGLDSALPTPETAGKAAQVAQSIMPQADALPSQPAQNDTSQPAVQSGEIAPKAASVQATSIPETRAEAVQEPVSPPPMLRSMALPPPSEETLSDQDGTLPTAGEEGTLTTQSTALAEPPTVDNAIGPALFAARAPVTTLTPRQGLERLIEELGFTGYQWIEDGDTVFVRPELSRTPALLWMNGTEGISYINYLGLSENGDYHLYQFDHLTWDIVEFNSCPTGQVTHLTRYAVPVVEGEILMGQAEEVDALVKGVLTPRQALDILLEQYPMPEDAMLIDTDEFLGWQTPLAPVGGDPTPDAQQVSTRLEYCRTSSNGKYYEFRAYSFLLDRPSEGLSHGSTLNFYAVPLDGGEILVERKYEGELSTDAGWEFYQASVDAYLEAMTSE